MKMKRASLGTVSTQKLLTLCTAREQKYLMRSINA